MAKGLPYFQFETSEWENGNIQTCTREEKGLFIDLCSMYWARLGDLPYKLALQKLCAGNATALRSLCDSKIIVEQDGKIHIKFLDIQLKERGAISKQNSEIAKKAWEERKKNKVFDANALRTQSERITNAMPIEENRIEENIKKEDSMLVKTASPYAKKIIPTLDEVIEYLVLEKNESQNEAEKFFDYYQANGWRVGKNPMKDWKAAARNWLKNASNYNKQTLKTNENGKQLSKQELEQQEFNRRYGTTFGQ